MKIWEGTQWVAPQLRNGQYRCPRPVGRWKWNRGLRPTQFFQVGRSVSLPPTQTHNIYQHWDLHTLTYGHPPSKCWHNTSLAPLPVVTCTHTYLYNNNDIHPFLNNNIWEIGATNLSDTYLCSPALACSHPYSTRLNYIHLYKTIFSTTTSEMWVSRPWSNADLPRPNHLPHQPQYPMFSLFQI